VDIDLKMTMQIKEVKKGPSKVDMAWGSYNICELPRNDEDI
jgi:hypothetical protein